jgi:hypothetical protein
MYNRTRNKREEKQRTRFDTVMPRRELVRDRGGEIADWTYGNVLTRVYRNKSGATGQVYYTFIQDRIYTRSDQSVGLSKTFYREDLGECVLGLGRARQFLVEQYRQDRNK